MATGLLKAGVDLDTLFIARTSAKRADVGFKVAGTDVSNRWEPLSGGGGIPATGFKAAGTDLASLFRGVTHTLTAGYSTPSVGVQVLGYSPIIGALSPASYAGMPIQALCDVVTNGVPSQTGFQINFTASLPNPWLTYVFINGLLFNASAAAYGTNGSTTWWWWPTFASVLSGNTYPVVIY